MRRSGLQSVGVCADSLVSPLTLYCRLCDGLRPVQRKHNFVCHKRVHVAQYAFDDCYLLSESGATAVHSVLSKGIPFNHNQPFMVCDSGGSAIVRRICIFSPHRFLYNKERCIGCGDPQGFRRHDPDFAAWQFFGRQLLVTIPGGALSQVLEKWHKDRNIPLSESNLTHYVHLFTFNTGKQTPPKESVIDRLDTSNNRMSEHVANGSIAQILIVHPTAPFELLKSKTKFLNGQIVVVAKELRSRYSVFAGTLDV